MEKSYKIDSKGNVRWLRQGGDLSGAPKEVKGNFDCLSCDLNSLEGGPKKVGGSYCCYSNENLKSLKGAAEIVGMDFGCSCCNLLTLEGGPKKVGGSYYCYNNNNLKSLRGICRAKDYILPEGFTLKDVERELKRQDLFKGMSGEETDLLDTLF